MLGKVEICGVNTATLSTLSPEETDELLRKVRAGDREARSRLIEGNLRLVLSVIQRFAARRSQKGESCDERRNGNTTFSLTPIWTRWSRTGRRC